MDEFWYTFYRFKFQQFAVLHLNTVAVC